MILISNPIAIANEINLIHSLFEEGLELFHIRKPGFSTLEMAKFIHQIKPTYRDNIVLYSQYQLAEEFGINRFHFSEKERKYNSDFPARFSKPCRSVNDYKSTSTHSIEEFNALENSFDYAFLSPVFKSISKENYPPKTNLFEEIKLRTNHKAKMIALGGIDAHNIRKTLENGFDDIALLGAIWNNENPIKQFKLCQQIAQSYSL